MKGQTIRLQGKLSSKDIMELFDLSRPTFYRYIKEGLFEGLIKRDALSDNYYFEPKDLVKIKKIIMEGKK